MMKTPQPKDDPWGVQAIRDETAALKRMSIPKRTVLIHLNVEFPVGDERNADEVAAIVQRVLDVALIDSRLTVCIPLVEEI